MLEVNTLEENAERMDITVQCDYCGSLLFISNVSLDITKCYQEVEDSHVYQKYCQDQSICLCERCRQEIQELAQSTPKTMSSEKFLRIVQQMADRTWIRYDMNWTNQIDKPQIMAIQAGNLEKYDMRRIIRELMQEGFRLASVSKDYGIPVLTFTTTRMESPETPPLKSDPAHLIDLPEPPTTK